MRNRVHAPAGGTQYGGRKSDELSFGGWLKQRRRARDLTQEQLGELVGCAAETIRRFEGDRLSPSRDTAQRLAEQLGFVDRERTAFVRAARSRSETRLAADDSSARLVFLTAGARDLPARQQTLRATIEWSHRSLTSGQQVVFRRLAVFAGGGSLDAVEEVCAGDGDITGDVFTALQGLLDANLVQRVDAADDTPRVRMLGAGNNRRVDRFGPGATGRGGEEISTPARRGGGRTRAYGSLAAARRYARV